MDEKQRMDLAKICGKRVQFDAPMGHYTTFRAGGKAEALYFPTHLAELKRVVLWLYRQGVPYIPLGNGSNLLVRDGGFEGVVIILTGTLSNIERDKKRAETLLVGAGVTISRLLDYCRGHGLGGVEPGLSDYRQSVQIALTHCFEAIVAFTDLESPRDLCNAALADVADSHPMYVRVILVQMYEMLPELT